MAPTELAPFLSPEQIAAASAEHPPVPKRCVVTGSSGFVGQRLVEMLVERGAEHVVAFDIAAPPKDHWTTPKIKYVQGDLRNLEQVTAACEGADCVWHNGGAVGPFHPDHLYKEVNYEGTKNVIAGCRKHSVRKLVYSSSPSTRFDGKDVDGVTEAQMPKLPQKSYLAPYAETKAMGELEVTAACCDELLTVSVAPHQVYGPRDTLFLPNVMETAGTGKLRIFGNGKNRICFSHVDNYCHGLILGERALYKDSPALGKFYVCTDGSTHPHKEGYALFWPTVAEAARRMGFADLEKKFHLPTTLMFVLAYICSFYTFLTGTKTKLTPFTVKMMVMHRWFDISAAEKDLGFSPIIPFNRGWEDTLVWFEKSWLPGHKQRSATVSSYGTLAQMSQEKINKQK